MTPPNKDYDNALNNAESEDSSMAADSTSTERNTREDGQNRDTNQPSDVERQFVSEDKYLAMEQAGVSYTDDKDPMADNPDHLTFRNEPSRNAQAFDQDEDLLQANVDLDENQSQSISSEEDVDTNTTDEVL